MHFNLSTQEIVLSKYIVYMLSKVADFNPVMRTGGHIVLLEIRMYRYTSAPFFCFLLFTVEKHRLRVSKWNLPPGHPKVFRRHFYILCSTEKLPWNFDLILSELYLLNAFDKEARSLSLNLCIISYAWYSVNVSYSPILGVWSAVDDILSLWFAAECVRNR